MASCLLLYPATPPASGQGHELGHEDHSVPSTIGEDRRGRMTSLDVVHEDEHACRLAQIGLFPMLPLAI